jgi:hypothetical protein
MLLHSITDRDMLDDEMKVLPIVVRGSAPDRPAA